MIIIESLDVLKAKQQLSAYCIHVYKLVGAPICPHCGEDSHETNSQEQELLRQAHIEKYGLFHQATPTWWSI